jgi:hypothetical protein
MKESDDNQHLICFTEPELEALLSRRKRGTAILGWMTAFLSALLAAVLGPFLYAAIHVESSEERNAKLLKNQANEFYLEVVAKDGLSDQFTSVAHILRQRSIRLSSAIASGKNDNAQSLLEGTGDTDAYNDILQAYIESLAKIDRRVRDIGSKVEQASHNSSRTRGGDDGEFAPYRSLLTRAAQNDYDCLSELVGQAKGAKVRCYTKNGSSFYLPSDQLSFMKDCEKGVVVYLEDLSAQLSTVAERRLDRANPYTLPALLRRIRARLSSKRAGAPPMVDWGELNKPLNDSCGANMFRSRNS